MHTASCRLPVHRNGKLSSPSLSVVLTNRRKDEVSKFGQGRFYCAPPHSHLIRRHSTAHCRDLFCGDPRHAASTCTLRTGVVSAMSGTDSTSTMAFSLKALGVALLLSGHGLRKKSLSLSGAVAAFLAGYAHLANPLKLFGVSLIVFYLLGSRATKVSQQLTSICSLELTCR